LGVKGENMHKKEKKIKPVNISELLKIYTPEKNNYTNLLCIRKK